MDTVDTVVFDIGGVLEVGEVIDRGGYPSWLAEIGASRGLDQTEVQARMRTVTGDLSEAELRSGYARALDLDEHTAHSFMAHLWDWYCGELNVKLWNWAVGLARTHRLAICSNSADGARREEERRYGFSRLFDPIVYSHEVGYAKPDPRIFAALCEQVDRRPDELVFIDDSPVVVEAALRLGVHAVHHVDNATTMTEVNALLRRTG